MESNVDIIVPPTEDQLQIIRKELNEDDDRSPHLENLLHTWINCQPHFPKNCDKRVIRSFLRNSKHDLDKTKRKLENNFTVRSLYPEIFSRRSTSAEDVIQAMDTTTMVYLPKLTNNGNLVNVFKLKEIDPSRFDVYATVKLFFMMSDLFLTSQHPIAGHIAIFDGEAIGAKHLVKLLAVLKIATPMLREAYSFRLKEIHVINAPAAVDKFMTVLKPLLHPKVKNAFKFHSTTESLCAHIGKERLPLDYGGNCKSLKELSQDLRKILINNENWFVDQESVKMTKMIPKYTKNNFYSKDLEIQGSFRSLQID